jgi:hypothetical protein
VICKFLVRQISQDCYQVKCKSVAGESPIGPRLGRGEPMPNIKESYETESEAEKARRLMEDYYGRFEAKRKKRRKRR